jgi:parvulin-like peptidyl-prolyl isomerase
MRCVLPMMLAACLLGGCGGEGPGLIPQSWGPPSSRRPPPAPPASQPASTEPVMAYVAGQPIMMSELVDLLVRAHGVPVAYQLVADELVRQAATAKGLTVSDEEVQAESERTLQELFGTVERADQRERMLKELLDRRGVSPKQWQLVMRRNVLLSKLAEPRVTVTDQDLAEEFRLRYGRRVQVRHIQTTSLAAAQEVLKQLAEGADFAELARRLSVNPSSVEGGLLPPIGPDSRTVPPAIREAALAMTRVGQISAPIQVETAYHILRLEKIYPPQDVDFDKVKEDLARSAHARLLKAEQQKVLAELVQAARDSKSIQYVDPVLKAEVEAAEEAQP